MTQAQNQADADLLIEALEGAAVLIQGREAIFRPVPIGIVHAARTFVAQHCRESCREFVRFMIEDAALSKMSAETYANYVWHALLTTGGHPVETLLRRELQLSTKNAIRSAIRQYALFTKRSELLVDLAGIRVKKLLRDRTAPTHKALQSFTEDEVGRILAAIDADKGNPRWPWTWPVLRIMIKLGLRAGADTPWIQRESVLHAVATGAPLTIWSKRLKQRGLPSGVVREELEMLAHWPGAWNYLSDIIAPATPPENRPQSSYAHLVKHLKEYAAVAGLDPSEVKSHRFRKTAALRLYAATKDMMLVANFLGHTSIETTQIYLQANRMMEMNTHLEDIYAEDEEEDDE
jgi:integrase